MKLKLLLSAFFIFLFATAKAQTADEYIGDLINRSDWFGLDEAYPKKKSAMQSEMLKGLSEVMLSAHFNKTNNALERLDTLLTYYQSELGLDNVYNLIGLKSKLYARQGLYQEASANCSHFLDQLATFNLSRDSFPNHLFIEKQYDAIAYVPKQEIVRPAHDVELSLLAGSADNDKLMYMPVTVHGKTYRFIIDAGAGFTFLPEALAKEMHVHLANESISLNGTELGIGTYGVIDSLQVGDIIFKNVIVFVGKTEQTDDPAFQIDAVLGLDFFRLIGETQFFPEKGTVVFPYKQSKRPKTGRNLLIDNNQLYLKAYSGKERLALRLSTGLPLTELRYPYYVKHKEVVETKGKKGAVFDGVQLRDTYRLPQFSLKVGKKKCMLKDVPVWADKITELQGDEVGILGVDFFSRFGKITLNLDQMFIEVK